MYVPPSDIFFTSLAPDALSGYGKLSAKYTHTHHYLLCTIGNNTFAVVKAYETMLLLASL